MRIGGITYPDINNGVGCRVTLWVSGCVHHRKGCHNPETWSFEHGEVFNETEHEKLFEALSKPYIDGLTLSGGDPLCSYEEVLELVKEVKERFHEKNIWLYTGYTKEYMDDNFKEILDYIDVLVDGAYIEEERDLSLAFRGSRNQRLWKKTPSGGFEVVQDEDLRQN